jgi:hypothetical protein
LFLPGQHSLVHPAKVNVVFLSPMTLQNYINRKSIALITRLRGNLDLNVKIIFSYYIFFIYFYKSVKTYRDIWTVAPLIQNLLAASSLVRKKIIKKF